MIAQSFLILRAILTRNFSRLKKLFITEFINIPFDIEKYEVRITNYALKAFGAYLVLCTLISRWYDLLILHHQHYRLFWSAGTVHHSFGDGEPLVRIKLNRAIFKIN